MYGIDRVVLIVLDSVGVGALPDAARFGDDGSDTLGNTARAVLDAGCAAVCGAVVDNDGLILNVDHARINGLEAVAKQVASVVVHDNDGELYR